LTTVAILFSLNYIISKFGLHAFSSMTFAYLRVLGSAIVLQLIFRQRDLPPLSTTDRWHLVGYSILGVVINQALFLTGLSLTSAHIAAILMTLIPLFTLAAAIIIGRERATVAKIAGIARHGSVRRACAQIGSMSTAPIANMRAITRCGDSRAMSGFESTR